MKSPDVQQQDQPPTKKLKLMPIHKLKNPQSKLPCNPFIKKAVNVAEAPPKPKPACEELLENIAMSWKKGHLEGKSKDIITIVANSIMEELIESALESILEDIPNKSPLKPQATETPSLPIGSISPTISDVDAHPILPEFLCTPKEVLSPALVQSENVPNVPTSGHWDRDGVTRAMVN